MRRRCIEIIAVELFNSIPQHTRRNQHKPRIPLQRRSNSREQRDRQSSNHHRRLSDGELAVAEVHIVEVGIASAGPMVVSSFPFEMSYIERGTFCAEYSNSKGEVIWKYLQVLLVDSSRLVVEDLVGMPVRVLPSA